MIRAVSKIKNDNFIRVRYAFDTMEPVVEHRTLEREKVGTWLFGLLPVYRYYYTEWKADDTN